MARVTRSRYFRSHISEVIFVIPPVVATNVLVEFAIRQSLTKGLIYLNENYMSIKTRRSEQDPLTPTSLAFRARTSQARVPSYVRDGRPQRLSDNQRGAAAVARPQRYHAQ